MQNINIVKDVKEIVKAWRKEGKTIGFVPTMGYLHSGHESLIKKARAENDKVVVSIFVNPTQFGPTEDLSTYPRDMESDTAMCNNNNVDLIFYPEPNQMYPEDFFTYVNIDVLGENLCGVSRPTHFRGVCTVVLKLFNIVMPDKAYFGKKDAQQLAIIKKMVEDLNINVEIIPCETVREEDGLAKSSRNSYLDKDERQAALVLSKSLAMAKEMIQKGEKNAKAIIDKMTDMINLEPKATIDYIKIVDEKNLKDVSSLDKKVIIALAVKIGKTRLIDNISEVN